MFKKNRHDQKDRNFLFCFLEKLSEEEQKTLKHNLINANFAEPKFAVPEPGFG